MELLRIKIRQGGNFGTSLFKCQANKLTKRNGYHIKFENLSKGKGNFMAGASKVGVDKLAVIGVGNLLLGDEGVGIHAVNELMNTPLKSIIKIIDGGTAGIDLLFWLEDLDYAIIVDCMDAGEKPGTILRFPVEEPVPVMIDGIMSIHDMGLWEVLSYGKIYGKLPSIVVYGVQPDVISFDTALSPEVKKALPRLLQLIKKEIDTIVCN